MALIQTNEVLAFSRRTVNFSRTASVILNEHVNKQASGQEFDIFLSHAFDDKELVLGVTMLIEHLGYQIYLDWRDDPQLDRKSVSAKTADVLRMRMRNCKCLLFATTPKFDKSQWMPWELGYKDGHNTRTTILPIVDTQSSYYLGKEYLGLYPYIDYAKEKNTGKMKLWVNRNDHDYVDFDSWLNGRDQNHTGDVRKQLIAEQVET
ncbi:MAG: toll-Interleukin receptor [Lentisphaeria bacterium]